MKQRIDYSQGTDTGYTNSDSISPVSDGEAADQTVFRRPSENLRNRTEVIRESIEDLNYIKDADRVMGYFGGGTIAWGGGTTGGGTGIFTTSADLILTPFLTVGSASSTPPVASTFGTLTLSKTGPAAGIIVTSKKRNYEKGDRISITVLLDNGISGTCNVLVEDTTHITLTVKNTSTLQNVRDAIIGDTSANALVGTALAGGAVNTDIILAPQSIQYITGNWDSEAHVVTSAVFSSFFGTVGNRLDEGDSICIWYNNEIEGTVSADSTDPKGGVLGGRRESIPENTNTAIPVGSLFNSRVHPEYLTNAIPIAKVVNDKLTFGNGIAIAKGSSSLLSTDTFVLKAGDTITGVLLPNASGLDFGSTSKRWDLFAAAIDASGNISAGNDISATGNLSTSSDLIVDGTSTLTGAVTLGANLEAAVAGVPSIGSTNRFDLFNGRRLSLFNNGTASNTVVSVVGHPAQSVTTLTVATVSTDTGIKPLAAFAGNIGSGSIIDNFGFFQNTGSVFIDDFNLIATNTNIWTEALTGTGVVQYTPSTDFSCVNLSTGATNNSIAEIVTASFGCSKDMTPMFYAKVVFKTNITNRVDNIGLTNIAYFTRDTSLSNNIKIAVTGDGGSPYDTGYAPTVDNAYFLLLGIDNVNSKIYYLISQTNWNSGGSPDASGILSGLTLAGTTSALLLQCKTLNTTGKSLMVDEVGVKTIKSGIFTNY